MVAISIHFTSFHYSHRFTFFMRLRAHSGDVSEKHCNSWKRHSLSPAQNNRRKKLSVQEKIGIKLQLRDVFVTCIWSTYRTRFKVQKWMRFLWECPVWYAVLEMLSRENFTRTTSKRWRQHPLQRSDAKQILIQSVSIAAEVKKPKESPLKREVQAVKSILQGATSSIGRSSSDHASTSSTDSKQTTRSDRKQQKKRNLLEVFKKPSSQAQSKDADKPSAKRSHHHVVDKFELECLDVLKVWISIFFIMNAKRSVHVFHFQHMKIPDNAKKELMCLIQMLDTIIKKKYSTHNIVEISESVQSSYGKFVDFISSVDSEFSNVSSELSEQIADFFEKVVMTRNHAWVCRVFGIGLHWIIHISILNSDSGLGSYSRLRLQTMKKKMQ